MPPTVEQEAEMQQRLGVQRARIEPSLPGRLMFHRVAGSRGHNLTLPTSDWDFLGVYVAPLRSVVGLKEVVQVVTQQDDENDRPKDPDQPDYQYYEVGKFASLLANGNPTAVECLYTLHGKAHWPEWAHLANLRRLCLTGSLIEATCGFVKGQLKLYRKHGYLRTTGGKANEKWFYHIFRMLRDAERVLDGEEPAVWQEGPERDHLMMIRKAAFDFGVLADHAEQLLERVSARERGHLCKKPPYESINDWLVNIRFMD